RFHGNMGERALVDAGSPSTLLVAHHETPPALAPLHARPRRSRGRRPRGVRSVQQRKEDELRERGDAKTTPMSDEAVLTSARNDVARARAGENIIDALLAHAERLRAMPWSNERYAVERTVRLALLASPAREGLVYAIERKIPSGWSGFRVRAVRLR